MIPDKVVVADSYWRTEGQPLTAGTEGRASQGQTACSCY